MLYMNGTTAEPSDATGLRQIHAFTSSWVYCHDALIEVRFDRLVRHAFPASFRVKQSAK